MLAFAWAIVFIGGLYLAPAQIADPAFPGRSGPAGAGRGLEGEVSEILRAMLRSYREASTYRDHGRLSVLQEQLRIREVSKMPSSVVLERPRRLSVVGGMQLIHCDGERLQIILDAARQYTAAPAPESLSMDHVRAGAPGAGLDEGYPEILEFLLGEDVYRRWTRAMEEIVLVAADPPKVVGDRACHMIRYASISRAIVTLYIDRETRMLLRCDIDDMEARTAGTAPSGIPPPKVQVALELFPVTLNGEIEPESFDLPAPAPGIRGVDRFDPGLAGADADESTIFGDGSVSADHALEGKSMPEIRGTDLGGNELSPDDFAGKVTLLGFWSARGGPDSLLTIPMIDRIAERYRARESPSFFALGLSAGGDDPVLVKELLAAKRAGFRNLADPEGVLSRKYGIRGLPSFLIVGPDLVIRKVVTGSPDRVEETLIGEIETLLGSDR